MSLKLGIVMDPITHIKINKDTSFAMLLEAQHRGYQIFYMEMSDLYLDNGKAMARMQPLSVQEDPQNWFDLGEEIYRPMGELDVLLMRKDPPFDSEYLYATQLFELAGQQGAMVVNNPQSLRDCNEKLFAAWFPEFCPATLVTRQQKLIRAFHKQHKDIICKPLDGMGGASIFRIKEDGNNLGVVIETLTNHGQQLAMIQEYLPAISEGDKRVLVVDGEVVPYALARLPSQGETRGNLAAGGTGRPQPLSDSDRAIAEAIAPKLVEKGLLFVGLDIIGDKLTEINVTSPTCVREIEAEFDINICAMLFDAIERRQSAPI
ncbi:glutathione synthase [Lacimicrobium alkaliphilum]|uniref:Glutathione synthetase n=1 Tax=Lacimicrobium alkaliphilum TaxID=1526571 RepID=A0ABQ1QZT6_9ALTE|nr:glutathione synthase [Lacimicrobium alkaliphilum]GGD49427.1 glutathione synthetase [Lacimicrobium alkaliphilum]